MTNEDAEKFVGGWQSYHRKIFRFKRDFLPDEYVTYKIDYGSGHSVSFKIMPEHSTYQLPDLSKDDMIRMIKRKELVYFDDFGFHDNVFKLKTGGCNCGLWVTSEGGNHSWYCPLHRDV